MSIQIIQHDEVQEYIISIFLNGYNKPHALNDFFKCLTSKSTPHIFNLIHVTAMETTYKHNIQLMVIHRY